jgi:predicted Zn-dependent protease
MAIMRTPICLWPIAVLAAVLLWASHACAQGSAPPITDAEEIRAGSVLAQKYEAREGLSSTVEIKRIESYLQQVGKRVAAHAERQLPYRFHFDPNPSFKSSVGLPGGQIFVGGGIVAYMDSEDELAIVLGHEIEHVALGQCRDRLAEELVKQHLKVAGMESLHLDPFLDSYGHEGEFAADLGGVKMAMAAGYAANAGIRLLRMFELQAEQMTHTPSEAKANLEARIGQIQPLVDGQKPAPQEKPLGLAP